MYKSYLAWFTVLLTLSSCSKTSPRIIAVCEETPVGNSLLKWETSPTIPGQVKVYASANPHLLMSSIPVGMADIADGHLTVVPKNPLQRTYYTLQFNNKYVTQVATRNIDMPGVQNFRDLGGYPSLNDHQERVRWGMLYRSAQIDTLDDTTLKTLKGLGIRTVVDFRSPAEAIGSPKLPGIRTVHIPIIAGDLPAIVKGLTEGKIQSDTIYRVAERINHYLISNYTDSYRQLFNVLLDASNYPVVLECSTGKGRTGIAAALILAALNVNQDYILYDYCLSNQYYNIRKSARAANRLPVNVQEALTTLFSSKEEYLYAAWDEVERSYGTMDNYLKEGIGLTTFDIDKLRELLLTTDSNNNLTVKR